MGPNRHYSSLVGLGTSLCLRNKLGDEGEEFHHFTARSTTRTMLSKKAARMGDKAKPSSVGAPTALLFEGGAGIIAVCRKNDLSYSSSRPFCWSLGYSVYSRFLGR